jgi:hypothetical protein
MKTLNELEKVFEEAEIRGHIYIGVAVKLPNLEESEIIINRFENFDEKLKYYKNAYSEDLTLKTCKDIHILEAVSGDDAGQVVFELS